MTRILFLSPPVLHTELTLRASSFVRKKENCLLHQQQQQRRDKKLTSFLRAHAPSNSGLQVEVRFLPTYRDVEHLAESLQYDF